jgi:hypothetical protein
MPSVAATALRVLTFRASRDELASLGRPHLAVGLACTWLVGMGRWWDDPGAHILQHLGLGSVAYVFVLSLLLWAPARPLATAELTYGRLLTFVTLTAPPAMLYAIPVERMTDLDTARTLNVWFLASVATWRVALYATFLRRFARLSMLRMVVATLLPLALVVAALTALNLERAVFDVMGGLRSPGTANDAAYQVLITLTLFSFLAAPVLVLAFIGLLAHDARARRLARRRPSTLLDEMLAQTGGPLTDRERRAADKALGLSSPRKNRR